MRVNAKLEHIGNVTFSYIRKMWSIRESTEVGGRVFKTSSIINSIKWSAKLKVTRVLQWRRYNGFIFPLGAPRCVMMQLGHAYEEQPGKSRIEETWPVHVPLRFCKIKCQMSHWIYMDIFCKALLLVTVDGSDQILMPAMTISMSELVRGGEGAPRERSSSNGFTLRVREVWLPKHRHATWSFGAFRSHYTSTVQWVRVIWFTL